eukprot:Awhi_evm1s373
MLLETSLYKTANIPRDPQVHSRSLETKNYKSTGSKNKVTERREQELEEQQPNYIFSLGPKKTPFAVPVKLFHKDGTVKSNSESAFELLMSDLSAFCPNRIQYRFFTEVAPGFSNLDKDKSNCGGDYGTSSMVWEIFEVVPIEKKKEKKGKQNEDQCHTLSLHPLCEDYMEDYDF